MHCIFIFTQSCLYAHLHKDTDTISYMNITILEIRETNVSCPMTLNYFLHLIVTCDYLSIHVDFSYILSHLLSNSSSL